MSDKKLTYKEIQDIIEFSKKTSEIKFSVLNQQPMIPMDGYTECSICKSTNLERSISFMRMYGGNVRCKNCNNVESFMSHIAKNIIKVEPLPHGATPIYFHKDEDEND